MPRSPLLPRRRPRSPSGTERIVGLILLLTLVGVVGLFVASGARPGPPGLPETQAATGRLAASPLPPASPGRWPRGEVETYVPDTLFEKINGKADAYFAYDFQQLAFASYTSPAGDGARYVDVYLYEMGSALDAFGIYRRHRETSGTAVDIGDEGSIAGASLSFRRGAMLGEVYGSGPEVAGEVESLARRIADALPASDSPVAIPVELPEAGRVSVGFARVSPLGLEGLSDAFVATYDDGTTILVAAGGSAEEGAASLPFLGRKGTFVTHGDRIVGVVGPADPAIQQQWLDRVLGAGEGDPDDPDGLEDE